MDKKNEVINLVMFTAKDMIIRMSKMALLCTFCWIQQKTCPSLGKILKCIWKVLFSAFTKYYRLWSSKLPLARCQHMKIHFAISLLSHHFFFLTTISHDHLSLKSLRILQDFNEIFQVYLNVFLELWLMFCCYQQKIQKISNFWHFKDSKSGSKHDNQTNHPNFWICCLSSILWYVSFQDLQNSSQWGSRFALNSYLQNTLPLVKKDTF